MRELTPAGSRLLDRFARHVGRGINRFSMIGPAATAWVSTATFASRSSAITRCALPSE